LILLFNLLVQSFYVSPFKTILLIFNLRFWWSVLLMFIFFCFFPLLFSSYCHYNTIFLFVNTFLKNIFKLSDILHIVLQTSNFSTFILLFFYSTVTTFARFLGLSTSNPLSDDT
jgi:hypothetical protein